jgi:hypothetical protein
MPYINQNRGDVRCGAYATAYWVWENAGGHPHINAEEYEEDVHNIYRDVRFNRNDMHIIRNSRYAFMADEVRGFSNPFKISDYLNNAIHANTKVVSANADLRHKLEVLSNGPLDNQHIINDLANGERAILIMGTNVGGQTNPRHYVYAVGNNEIQLLNNRIGMTIIDPAYGERLDVGYNLSAWADSFHGMQFLDTVIR